MLLAIDVGNTNINFGVFAGNKLVKKFIIPTTKYQLAGLKRKLGRQAIDGCIICSVVPRVNKILKTDLKKVSSNPPFILGDNLKVEIKNLYRKPAQVGQDRLVNGYAAIKLYGAPSIIIDSGTAVTFDVISKNSNYLGGMILPGLNISLEALNKKTALLPKIKLAKPVEFIGRDTRASILSGIVYGMAALIDDLTRRIKKEIGRNAKVIGTGGNIKLIAKFCRNIQQVDTDLTLKGLQLVYENTQ